MLNTSALRSFLTTQLSGIALLTLLPFIIMGLIFDPWNGDIIESMTAGTPYIYHPFVATILVILTLAVTIVTKKTTFITCVLSSGLLLGMALKQHEVLFTNGPDWRTFYTLYAFTALLSFPVIAQRPTVSSWLFRTVLVLLLLDTVVTVFTPSYAVLSPLFMAYFPSHVSIIICILLIALLRMIRKLHTENAPTRKQLRELAVADPQARKKLRIQTLSLWWPMVFIFLVFTLGYQLLQERYVNQPLIAHLNALGTEHPVEIYEGGDAVKNPQQGPPPQTVEQASKAAVSRLSSAQSKAIKRQIDLRIKNAGDDKDAAYKAVKDSMPKRFPGTKTKDCPALDVDCYGANIAKNTINSAYLSAKKSMLADLKLKLNRVEGTGKAKAAQIKTVIDDTFKNFETQTNRRITNVATGMRYINWAALIYGIIILFKSLMIVFARVFYARVSTAPAQKCAAEEEELSTPHESPAKNGPGKMTRARHKYTLTRDDGYRRYYINFRSCGNNVIDRRRIPQPFSLIFRRMIAKNYVMCQIDLNADDSISGCDIIVDPPAEIVIWDLNEQDEVLIDMRALIGFSETCRLGRIISLSLGSLIFGKAVYYSVKGPGRIFVRTASAPIAGGDKDINNVMQASSLIAWQRDTTFNVISSLTRSDTFFSGYSIRKFGRQTHLVIYDTSQRRRVSAGQGIFKMARAFLVPF